ANWRRCFGSAATAALFIGIPFSIFIATPPGLVKFSAPNERLSHYGFYDRTGRGARAIRGVNENSGFGGTSSISSGTCGRNRCEATAGLGSPLALGALRPARPSRAGDDRPIAEIRHAG